MNWKEEIKWKEEVNWSEEMKAEKKLVLVLVSSLSNLSKTASQELVCLHLHCQRCRLVSLLSSSSCGLDRQRAQFEVFPNLKLPPRDPTIGVEAREAVPEICELRLKGGVLLPLLDKSEESWWRELRPGCSLWL